MSARTQGLRLVSSTTVFLVLGLTVATANADTIHVCWDGSVDYLTIQAGIDAAQDGDEVVVCDGTYTGPGNKNLDFGGKAITVRSENGPENCVIDCEGDGRGFYFHSGETDASVVEGFTILNSDTSAIECRSAGATIINCVIRANGVPGYGAGIRCSDGANATILDCTIMNNVALWGAAISCEGSELTMSGCTITGNWASVRGTIYLLGSSGTIVNCTITGNRALGDGGGVYCRDGCSPTIANCIISGNLGESGSGIYCIGPDTDPTITNCIIAGNAAYLGGGGVVSAGAANPTMANCTITGNSADLYGGGLYCVWGSSPRITNSILWDDTPEEVYLEDGDPLISYCDVQGGWPGQGNIDSDPLFLGGPPGSWTADGSYDPQTSHVTFTDASAMWGESELVGKFVNPDLAQSLQLIIIANTGTTITVWADWWTIYYYGASWVTSGMSYQIYDYHLTGGVSPCIDTADPDFAAGPDERDIDGHMRLWDGDDDDECVVDMGSDEFASIIPGDLNGDGCIDHADLGILLGDWGCNGGDMDCSGHTDQGDLGILLAHWGEGCP